MINYKAKFVKHTEFLKTRISHHQYLSLCYQMPLISAAFIIRINHIYQYYLIIIQIYMATQFTHKRRLQTAYNASLKITTPCQLVCHGSSNMVLLYSGNSLKHIWFNPNKLLLSSSKPNISKCRLGFIKSN